jgi:hypothetical protein
VQKFIDQPDLMLGALQACVGPAAGIELKAFIDNLDNLPDIDAIVKGESAPVPKEIDLQYAVAAALVGRAIRVKGKKDEAPVFGHILDYAGRFPQREMGVMLVSDMQRAVGEKLFSVPQFAQWARSIADVMLFDMWKKEPAAKRA